jgi:hypothetical protein
MVEPSRIQEISDRLEIGELLVRYCTAIDSKRYDDLDFVFRGDAVIDYTSAGGIRGALPEIKQWLSEVLSLFPMTQHVVGNVMIRVQGDRATSRCAFFNPMGLPLPEGKKGLKVLFFGGYYNDSLARTADGWRIVERVEESTWDCASVVQEGMIPTEG